MTEQNIRPHRNPANTNTFHLFQDGSLPRIALPVLGSDSMQDIDSDQDSLRNMSDNNRGQARMRRHTLPPILPEPEL